MANETLTDAVAQQRIDILEREKAEAYSLIARLTGDIKLAISQGFSTNVGEGILKLTDYELKLVKEAYHAGHDLKLSCVTHKHSLNNGLKAHLKTIGET